MSSASGSPKSTDESTTWKRKSFLTSFGRLLYEQSVQWPLYILLLAGCFGAAAAFPLQSWLFAKLINVIGLPPDQLSSASSHWALMFFLMAIGAAAAYFTLGASSHAISVVR
jgi:ATP-binding cassette subfamily B (MDR/TAP) protein 1